MRDIKCGELFCERCGDCYACDGEEVCLGAEPDSEHVYDFSLIIEEDDGAHNS